VKSRLTKLPPEWADRVHGAGPAVRQPAHQSHTTGQMNKTEARYAAMLQTWLAAEGIEHWSFETLKIRLAANTYYTPDFAVWRAGRLEFHEVKGGFIRDKSRIKFRCAAEALPWAGFVMMQWKDGQWTRILALNKAENLP
jgi:hypothetical protein